MLLLQQLAPSRSVNGGPLGPADSANIAFLAGWEGIDGARSFVDESPTPLGITFAGVTSELDSAQSKFGSSSLYLDATGYVLIAHDPSISISNPAFTVEAWIRPDAASIARGLSSIFNKRDGAGAEEWAVYLQSGQLRVTLYRGGVAEVNIVGGGVLTANAWYHVCFIRDGSSVYLFLNGVRVGTGTITLEPSTNIGDLNLGRSAFAAGREYTGHYDEVRICQEVFYDTAGFDVPAAAFNRP